MTEPTIDNRAARVSVHPDTTLTTDLPQLAARWHSGELSDATCAAAYFLLWQIDRYGTRFASRTTRTVAKPDAEQWRSHLLQTGDTELKKNLTAWFRHYRFFRVIPSVPEALHGWLQQGWPLRLLTHIPTPLQVLDMQVQGIRPVTLISDYSRAIRPVLGKASGFDFLVHDLEHAWKFCHDPDMFHAQRRFFALIARTIQSGLLDTCLSEDIFARQFDYLISDMNTHPVHSLRYLHAVLIECLLRREGKDMRAILSEPSQQELLDIMAALARLWELPPPAGQALINLARGQFDTVTDAAHFEQALLSHRSQVAHT